MPSTVIRSYRYDADTRRLLIEFVTGRRYVYLDVPPDIQAALRAAHSRGSFFNTQIRDHFEFERLSDAARAAAE